MSYPAQPQPTRPPLHPGDERTWSTLLHLSPLVGLSLWVPLIVWLVFRGRGPFLEHHAKDALNFHITIVIAAVGAGVLTLITVGMAMPLIFVVVVWQIVFAIIAAVAANRGEWYHYPATIRFVS